MNMGQDWFTSQLPNHTEYLPEWPYITVWAVFITQVYTVLYQNPIHIFVSHSVNRLLKTITLKWSTGSRFWLQRLFRKSLSGWRILYFLSKKQTNFSAAPAPSALLALAKQTQWVFSQHYRAMRLEESGLTEGFHTRTKVTSAFTQCIGSSQSQRKCCVSLTPPWNKNQ